VPGIARRGIPVELGQLAEYRLVQPVQPRVRIDAELIGEPGPQVAIDAQRVGLPAAPVQGEHLLAAQPLPERMRGDQAIELADQRGVAAAGQVSLHPVLQRAEPRFLQPCHVRLGEGEVGHVGQRRAAPERERGPQPGSCRLGLALVQIAPRDADQGLEPAGV
jgi:hypothetical protein